MGQDQPRHDSRSFSFLERAFRSDEDGRAASSGDSTVRIVGCGPNAGHSSGRTDGGQASRAVSRLASTDGRPDAGLGRERGSEDQQRTSTEPGPEQRARGGALDSGELDERSNEYGTRARNGESL